MQHHNRRLQFRGICFKSLALALALLTIFTGGSVPSMHTATAEAPAEDAQLQEEEESEQASDLESQQNQETLTALVDDTALDFQQKLDAVFAKFKTLGAVVCVIVNGEIAYTFTYGDSDAEGTPMTEDTMFRIGSISKMVTAIGVFQFIEDHRATLDGDLSQLLGVDTTNPVFPGRPLTLRQVMSHTSGLRDSGYYAEALAGDIIPLEELFTEKRKQYLYLPYIAPGARVKYSNFGGGLLGSLIERMTGQSVDEYMNEVVFEPMGITAAYRSSQLPKNRPVTDIYYMPQKRVASYVQVDTVSDTPDPMLDYTLTAGKLTISAPDLAKVLIALCDGGIYGDTRIMAESSALAMRTPQNNIGSVTCESNRGLCMNIITDTLAKGRTLYGHGGKAYGMLCAAYFDPTDRTGVVMMTNGTNNKLVYQNVGMLSSTVVQLCYTELIENNHVAENPWLVVE